MPSWILTWLFYYSHQPPSRSTLSLHDALPIFSPTATTSGRASSAFRRAAASGDQDRASWGCTPAVAERPGPRSEEHTSELQSRGHLVCRLLLEKKNFRSNEEGIGHGSRSTIGV